MGNLLIVMLTVSFLLSLRSSAQSSSLAACSSWFEDPYYLPDSHTIVYGPQKTASPTPLTSVLSTRKLVRQLQHVSHKWTH